MKNEFSYLEKDGQHFPIVEVALARGDRTISVKALVDSGASFCIFHHEVAEYLGLKIERGRKVSLTGIGGRIFGYLHNVTVNAGGQRFECKIVFSRKFKISFNLLGRDNFFAPFKVSFIESQKKVVIESV